MDSPLTLSVRNLAYQIGTRMVLKNINFDLARGEVLGVIGPNGAGKSTLLRLLTADIPQTAGEIVFAGRDLGSWLLLNRARQLAVLPQGTQLDFPFTVADVVALGRTPHQELAQQSDDIINEVMDQCDVLALKSQLYTTLSGGEQQRVQLARVLAQIWRVDESPHLLILDEPSNALDFFHQRILLNVIQSLAEKGASVILITHDMNLVCQCASRVIGLKHGEMIFEGKVAETMTEVLLSELYDTAINILTDPRDGVTPRVVGL